MRRFNLQKKFGGVLDAARIGSRDTLHEPSTVNMEAQSAAMLTAARAHDLLGVCGALAAGVSPTQTDVSGLTALMLACSSPESGPAISIVAALLSGDGRAVLDAQSRERLKRLRSLHTPSEVSCRALPIPNEFQHHLYEQTYVFFGGEMS